MVSWIQNVLTAKKVAISLSVENSLELLFFQAFALRRINYWELLKSRERKAKAFFSDQSDIIGIKKSWQSSFETIANIIAKFA